MCDPIVSIPQGKLRGKLSKDVRGSNFYSFKGIPYAEPPVGKLRFKAPQKHKGWSGVLDSTKEGSECYQKYYLKGFIGSEDCLNLNVYTPELPANDKNKLRAVMVWIHGGAFIMGSNRSEMYGPEFLLTEDIVLVTLNYRLGILGFLAFDDRSVDVPGNAAFKDMILALEWIRDNIKHFNGDPDNVTISGESAGGIAAHMLMLSPLADGLFHKTIVQSGSALIMSAPNGFTGEILAESMGFEGKNQAEMLDYLQNIPIEEIYKNQPDFSKTFFRANKVSPIGYVIEPASSEKPFLTKSPLDLLKSGRYNKVPLMIGFTTKEGYVFHLMPKIEDDINSLLTNFETSVPQVLGIEAEADVSKQIGEDIKQYYFKKSELTRNDMNTFFELVGERRYLREILRSIRYHVDTSSQPVYLYQMSIESKLNIMKKLFQIKGEGVAHGDDIGYLFRNMLTPKIEDDSIEDISQRRFARLWANFVKYGNPTPSVQDTLLPVVWEPVRKDSLKYLDINKELTVQEDPMEEKMKFWEEIFSRSQRD